MFAVWLHNLDPFIFRVTLSNGSVVGPRWYGLSYVMAGVCGWWLYRWLSQRKYNPLKPEQVADFITWAGFAGVLVGGRLGWILLYGVFQDHAGDPWWMFRVWEGGMSSHGGILGLVLFTWLYARHFRVSWTGIGDSLCVVAPVGLFLVRCANFINGELYGKPTDVAWAVQFPGELTDDPALAERLGLLDPAVYLLPNQPHQFLQEAQSDPGKMSALREVLSPRHPSQLYEAILEGVVLFTALWLIRTRCRVPRGVLTGTFFILYAMLRILGEVYRVPDRAWSVGPFSAGQFLSLFMFGIGAAFLVWGFRKREYEQADERPVAD